VSLNDVGEKKKSIIKLITFLPRIISIVVKLRFRM